MNMPMKRAAQQVADIELSSRKRAVLYLRVSTTKQAGTDEDAEGFSLPAQRESGRRKAEQLGADIVDEYVDRGESAKSADRPRFQAMLRRIQKKQDVDYVIVDKIDRFARNRRDDANLLFDLQSAGAQLISVKENIDETPSGQLLHAVMAGISEWYSRNLATEAIKGMTQKAKVGGTPGRAPIGYLNAPRRVEDREIRSVVVDPERSPLVQWAFEAYATGEWTTRQLVDALNAKGLRSLPHGKKTTGKLAHSQVCRILTNRYYLGYVTFRGVEYQGRHQPLVSEQLFETVQNILRSKRHGEKQRTYNHYLKSSVFCARCGSQLCITNAKGKYLYFFCLGRQQRRTDCDLPYLSVAEVEEAVIRYYGRAVRLPEKVQDFIRRGLHVEMDKQAGRAAPEIAWAKRRVNELESERRRLARGVIDGSIPGDLAREEQERIAQDLRDAQRVAQASEAVFGHIEETLNLALSLLGRCDEVYRQGGAQVRRLSNQFFFSKLLLDRKNPTDDVEVAGAILNDPWATVMAQEFLGQMEANTKNPDQVLFGQGSKEMQMVGVTGLEPVTSAV